jgi:hypothetical protein
VSAEHPAAKLSLLDRFNRWRYYRREYRLARMRGQSQYMPPPWVKK